MWGEPFDISGDKYRFTYDYHEAGLVATPCDKIATHIRHTGYADDFQDETLRGYVFQPMECDECDGEGVIEVRVEGKAGPGLGYMDAERECEVCDGGRDYPAVYYHGYISSQQPESAIVSVDPTTERMDAAIWADHAANVIAEKEREYSEAYHMGTRCADLDMQIRELEEDYERMGVEVYKRGPVMDAAKSTLDSLRREREGVTEHAYFTDELEEAFREGYRGEAGVEFTGEL